jgi:hypothetical protein
MAKNPIGRQFSSKYETPAISFAAALHGDLQPQPQQAQMGTTEEISEQAARPVSRGDVYWSVVSG